MNCRRWCFGVTVVVVAIGMGGLPAAAQQPLPAVEVPGVTVPSVTVPVPPGSPKIATPQVSKPPISTPPVHVPAVVTPVGTLPSVSVAPVTVGSVTVSPVRTAPAGTSGKPPAGSGASSKASEPPPSAAAPAARPEARATPALAVRGTSTRHGPVASVRPSAPDAAGRADQRAASRSTGRRHAAPSDSVAVRAPADSAPTPAIRVLDDREARTAVPVAETIERHQADARPLIDALGRALDLAPLLMALALGGALCVVSRQMRRAG